jgi:hypothetical protein
MKHTIQNAQTEDKAHQEIREVVAELNSHRTRKETRTMVRK